ncbi:MAG TPA: T9SS type A sorting domain-containing protein [Flavobacteriales bacterium]|nr:T9SS type A sorting domain-containing protein [Flavobacteriales bacterium]
MKLFNRLATFTCLMALTNVCLAQTRYLDEVFTGVTVTSDVVYGNNLWCTMLGDCNTLTAKDILMDVYEPVGDTIGNAYYDAERPLVIIAHTGNFLARVLNGAPTGFKDDSAVVEMCSRFAKKGYVAAAMSYRLGWNPTAVGPAGQAIRTGTIINAAYRGVQDAHTCIRFFKKDVDLSGNTYRIDSSRIVLGGIGTGSYVSFAFASFDRWEEIYLNKFIDFTDPLNPVPYIDTAQSGDFKSLSARPMNTPNHVGYNSNIDMVFNLGGAMGDSSWLEIGDVPIISFHCTKDENAPYGYGGVFVPTTGDLVLNASGSSDVIRRSNYLCNNNIFKMPPVFTDIYSTRANALNSTGNLANEAGIINPNAGDEGLYPFVTPAPGASTCTDPFTSNVLVESEQGSPWDWWDESWYNNIAIVLGNDGPFEVCRARLSNPDMSAAKGKAYIDTIQGYLTPRIYRVLFESVTDTGCTVPIWAGIDNVELSSSSTFNIFPNPSSSSVTITSSTMPVKGVELYDVTGRLVFSESNINTKSYTFERGALVNGLYFVKVKSEDAEMDMKILFQ